MSNEKQDDDEKVPPSPSGLYEESSVIQLLESQSAEATGDLTASAAVESDDGDSKQPAAATIPIRTSTSTSTSMPTPDKQAPESQMIPPAKPEKESGGIAPVPLERSAAIRAVSQPGAFPIDGVASASIPYRSFAAPEVSSPSLPLTARRRDEHTEVLVSAELVEPEPTQVADVEVGQVTVVAVEAKPLEEKEDQSIRLIDLWKNRTLRIIAVLLFLIIVGLIVGLVVGLQKSTKPTGSDDQDDDRDDD